MNWMPRILLFAALCLLPSIVVAQEETTDDAKQPAPGEPGGELKSSEAIEAYERSISPIKGTAPDGEQDTADADSEAPASAEPHTTAKPVAEAGKPTTAAVPDITVQIEKLQLAIEQRLAALEKRIDAQVARIDALESTTIVARKLVEEDGEMADAAEKRDAEVARLKADLDQLRTDISEQLQGLQAREAADTESQAQQAQDSPSGGEGHRLRIHNTTGVEQPITINGVQWTVRADEWSSVPIPRGPVTVHRPGQGDLEVAAEEIDWQSDQRGYFFDYDLNAHRVAKPAVQ